ncbi:MAG: DEAD/DEAH box helicase [Candidatus Nanohaloarchaeota archaeon QJJ-9]|nr:DEAD/DEAH box helicase [Candidatus Nanohaloarchaeota archaeon QJJ-9]
MNVGRAKERGVPDFLVERIKEKGIEELNPPQEQAINSGVLEGENMIVSSPTASGKTLIATLSIGKTLREGKKALYLVPLKALASEKYRDYKELFEGKDYRVGMNVGDKDSSGKRLASKDLIIMTVEKLDAILRHKPSWIKDVGLVVEDEIHLLNSEERGPTVEVTLTRLKDILDFQVLGLSATISNSDELAEWLDAELVKSEYRPVDLKEGVYHSEGIEYYLNSEDIKSPKKQKKATFKTGKEKLEEREVETELKTEKKNLRTNKSRATLNVLENTLSQDKQMISFVRSRKSAESEAEKQGKVTKGNLSREEHRKLEELSKRVKNVLGNPTKQCKRLSRCIKHGTAFHHAGLVGEQRHLIEDAFKDNLIKSISATPTLAAGVSLPAYRIVIRDVKRYTNSGLDFIPVLEYKQMAGRAGRPEHHDEGEAIAVAKDSGSKEEIRDRYILGEPEKIYSKLAMEPVLRMHTLSLIATGFAPDFDSLEDFFSKTFYAYQYGEISEIKEKLKGIVEKLEEYDFVEAKDRNLRPTKLGKRVSELYIDPKTAYHLIETLEEAREKEETASVGLLQAIANTVEMQPLLKVKKGDKADLEDLLQKTEDRLLEEIPEPWEDYDYNRFLKSFKTALMLEGWINEEDEDEMMERFGVTPGGIRAKVENADWLLYACQEIATLKEWENMRNRTKKLRTRVKHGIKEELVRLVRFKGIGRVRARRLYEKGIETTSDIREVGFTRLKKMVGKRTAKRLKEEVGQDNVFDKENVLDYFKKD